MAREEACKKAQIIDFQGGYTIALVTEIYNNHEAQLKAKDEEIKELGEIVQQYLIPSKNYDAIIKAKDEEIRRLNNLYADTIKELGDKYNEDEMLKDNL